MSKDKPMLFSTDMVKAILTGSKTETRRTSGLEQINRCPNDWANIDIKWVAEKAFFTAINRKSGDILEIKCPYGTIHSEIWIRETWRHLDLGSDSGVVYKASENGKAWQENSEDWTWKPSIQMPKKFARIWLKIEHIGIDRLNNISNESAIAEGIEGKENDIQYSYKDYLSDEVECYNPVNSFQSLWEKINGIGSWDFNPWVWVIKFKTI
jgi:hypothetical protein